MPNAFLYHLEHWLPAVLRTKAIESTNEERLHLIGAQDLAVMFSEYVLGQLSVNPTSCWTGCEFDHLSDEQLVDATACSPEMLAAAFIGAVIELSPWQGDEGVAFLTENGVPSDDAREFSAAVDVVGDKLGARGQAMIVRLGQSVGGLARPGTVIAASQA